MPHEKFAAAAKGGPALLGGWITLDAMPIVELLAGAGFDYLGIDTQHSMIDPAAAAELIYARPADGPPLLVRVPGNDAPAIGKLLDNGADGIIVPMVNSAAEAEAAVASCFYAPRGHRSFGPVKPSIGRDVAALQERIAVFVMIETAQAVENIDAIVRTPGLTGIYLGPADLAVSMGLPPVPATTPPAISAAVQRVAAACDEAGIIAGGHGLSANHARELIGAGFRLVSLTADKGYMLAGAALMLKQCRGIGG